MRTALIATGMIVLSVFGTTIVQDFWLRTQLRSLGVEGALVDVGGRKIHLKCSGGGRLHYVLEAGALGTTENWSWLQDSLDDDARVCSYDRAGLGASDVNPDGFESGAVARDLKTALDAAGERGPFVLVGHSLGGVFARQFAAAYPADTAALVLVDPSHEDQLARFPPGLTEEFETFRSLAKWLPVVAQTGLLRVWNPIAAAVSGLEGASLQRARLYVQDPAHLASASEELQAWNAIMARVRSARIAPAVPVLVVTAGRNSRGGPSGTAPFFLPLHRDLAGRSLAGSHQVIADADHFSVLTDRVQADHLTMLIRDFLSRTGPSDPAR